MIPKPEFERFYEQLKNNPPEWLNAATSAKTGFVVTLVNKIIRTVDDSEAVAVKEEDNKSTNYTFDDSEEEDEEEPQLKRSRR